MLRRGLQRSHAKSPQQQPLSEKGNQLQWSWVCPRARVSIKLTALKRGGMAEHTTTLLCSTGQQMQAQPQTPAEWQTPRSTLKKAQKWL